jgi:hypothetical protein
MRRMRKSSASKAYVPIDGEDIRISENVGLVADLVPSCLRKHMDGKEIRDGILADVQIKKVAMPQHNEC